MYTRILLIIKMIDKTYFNIAIEFRSSISFFTLCVNSKGSPPLMRIPLMAPTPVPTMTAVGVANPKAQGQAILNTVIANWKAFWNISSCLVTP